MPREISRRALLQHTGVLTVGAVAASGLPNLAARAEAAAPTAWTSGDITFALRSLRLTPGGEPSGSTNVDRAWALLTDGRTDDPADGVTYDFAESMPADDRYVDLNTTFVAPADVRTVRLTFAVPSEEFEVRSCMVSFVAPDGTINQVVARIGRARAGIVTATAVPPFQRAVRSLVVRVTTTKRLALTEFEVIGAAHGVVNLAVTDPAAFHVHAPGQPFVVEVTPEVVAFGDVTHLLGELTLTPGTKPFATRYLDKARTLLTDGRTDYVPDVGVLFDFWGTPEDLRYVDLALSLPSTSVSSVTLNAFNMNGEYDFTGCTVTLVDEGGATTTKEARLTRTGGLVTAQLVLAEPVVATSVVARMFTPYKLNLTEVSLTGATRTGLSLPDPALLARWKDFRGHRLTDDVALTVGTVNRVSSPPNPGRGYYGLEFVAGSEVAFADHLPGERREYGFTVTELRGLELRTINPGSTCGMVHNDIKNPYLGGWSKNTSWQTGTFDANAWHATIQARRAVGLLELPLVSGGDWDAATNADKSPLTQEQLDALQRRLRDHLRADQTVEYWELGIEENLRSAFHDGTYYWSNLDAKVSAAHRAADEAGRAAKWIYQVAEPNTRRGDVTAFLQSTAARKFDVLSLHPYAWPDFASPETWMQPLMDFVHAEMARTGVRLPIWLTEVGAPHAGNYPGGWFGYGDRNDPATRAPVTGLSRLAEVGYLVKVHVLGFQLGADKVFWYNYQDGGSDRTYPEHHFGTRDFWGFPKPAYAAYAELVRLIDGREPAGLTRGADNLWWATFTGVDDDVHVGWRYPHRSGRSSWTALRLHGGQVIEIVDAVGARQPVDEAGPILTANPLYVRTKH